MSFEEEALNAHNEYRAMHGVPPLELCGDMCAYAAEWAQYLVSCGSMQHRSNNQYGENLYCMYGSGVTVNGMDPVKMWYDEIGAYNYGSPGFSMETGHFTQVVWRNSTKMGIAIAHGDGQVYVVANYDPPGNYEGQYEENVPMAG